MVLLYTKIPRRSKQSRIAAESRRKVLERKRKGKKEAKEESQGEDSQDDQGEDSQLEDCPSQEFGKVTTTLSIRE